MHGNAPCIDSRYTSRSNNNFGFLCMFLNVLKKSCFAGAGFTSKKNVPGGVIYKIRSQFEYSISVVCLQHCLIGFSKAVFYFTLPLSKLTILGGVTVIAAFNYVNPNDIQDGCRDGLPGILYWQQANENYLSVIPPSILLKDSQNPVRCY